MVSLRLRLLDALLASCAPSSSGNRLMTEPDCPSRMDGIVVNPSVDIVRGSSISSMVARQAIGIDRMVVVPSDETFKYEIEFIYLNRC